MGADQGCLQSQAEKLELNPQGSGHRIVTQRTAWLGCGLSNHSKLLCVDWVPEDRLKAKR